MTTIHTSKKPITEISTKYCQVAVSEESPSKHRFIEQADGTLVYKMGGGKWDKITPRTFRTLVRSIIVALKSHQITHAAIALTPQSFPLLSEYGEDWFYQTLAENLTLAHYEYTVYKSKQKDERYTLAEILVCDISTKAAEEAFAKGLTIATYVNRARDIANTHGDDLTPKVLAQKAKELAKGTKVTVSVLGRKDIAKEKMGLLQAVGKGSHNEEQFIIMEYYGAGKPGAGKVPAAKQPLVLIGKGVTYDTGGLNVKPAGSMHDMHMDMSGGSSVMAAIVAAAKLGIKKNIIALIPAAENAISSTSMRAGDIVTSLSGQTVEILHTDAEGRMILADALTYCTRYTPRAIIDVATLTGAALSALGQYASALLTTNDELAAVLRTQSEKSGDLVWPLPLWDEYKASLKSNRADISNIATNFAKWGGCIEGGAFLSFFAPKNVPWAHIDIAPRMDSIPSDKLVKGSTGEPVRLLVAFLESY